MAAGLGANLTSNVSVNKPSFFEVLAQENLSSAFRSAFLYLINLLAESDHEKYFWLRSRADEVYLFIDTIVQLTHLKAYNASFSEKFYGLLRVSPKNHYHLPSQELYASLLLLTGYPYLKRKLDLIYSNLRRSHAEVNFRSNSKEYLFLKTYPLLSLTLETTNLIYYLRYAVGNSNSHSPLLDLVNVELKYFVKPTDQSIENNFSWHPWLLAKYMASSLGVGLSVGAFFLQFLEFFYARDNATLQLTRLPIPPPPAKKEKLSSRSYNCPLCNERRHNETVLLTSGYVFCYSCIKGFISRNKKCPATGFPSTLESLIRLYPQGS